MEEDEHGLLKWLLIKLRESLIGCVWIMCSSLDSERPGLLLELGSNGWLEELGSWQVLKPQREINELLITTPQLDMQVTSMKKLPESFKLCSRSTYIAPADTDCCLFFFFPFHSSYFSGAMPFGLLEEEKPLFAARRSSLNATIALYFTD